MSIASGLSDGLSQKMSHKNRRKQKKKTKEGNRESSIVSFTKPFACARVQKVFCPLAEPGKKDKRCLRS
ncbi:MAG: hypothetical protein IJ083_06970 [Clostridia bacterium]|nr:hypothetical protein [Clostridia bacterium]